MSIVAGTLIAAGAAPAVAAKSDRCEDAGANRTNHAQTNLQSLREEAARRSMRRSVLHFPNVAAASLAGWLAVSAS